MKNSQSLNHSFWESLNNDKRKNQQNIEYFFFVLGSKFTNEDKQKSVICVHMLCGCGTQFKILTFLFIHWFDFKKKKTKTYKPFFLVNIMMLVQAK